MLCFPCSSAEWEGEALVREAFEDSVCLFSPHHFSGEMVMSVFNSLTLADVNEFYNQCKSRLINSLIPTQETSSCVDYGFLLYLW